MKNKILGMYTHLAFGGDYEMGCLAKEGVDSCGIYYRMHLSLFNGASRIHDIPCIFIDRQ